MIRCPRNNKMYDVASHNDCPNKPCAAYRASKQKGAAPVAPLKGVAPVAPAAPAKEDDFVTVGKNKEQASSAT
jgi:hypothetical protein